MTKPNDHDLLIQLIERVKGIIRCSSAGTVIARFTSEIMARWEKKYHVKKNLPKKKK